MNTITKTVAAAVLAATSSVAQAQQMNHDQMHQGQTQRDLGQGDDMQKMMQSMMSAPGDADSTKALKDAHMTMMMGSLKDYSGNPDVDFYKAMIPHHQGAIDMAKVELQYGTDPVAKKMAQKIIADQEREIAEMDAWLKKNAK